jgi:hypothetical protein
MDLQTVTVLITGISVIIAAVNSIFSSRRAEEQRALTLKTQQQALETRQAQLFMQIYNRWSTKEFADAYEKLRFVYKQEEWDAMLENMLD